MLRSKPGWLLAVVIVLVLLVTLFLPTLIDGIDGRVGSFAMVAVTCVALGIVIMRWRRR